MHYAIVKGEVLSQLCYNHLGERISSDIDILVPREELSQIESILNKHGFVSQTKRVDRILKLSTSHELGAFIKEANGIRTILDVNFDIFWGEYICPMDDVSNKAFTNHFLLYSCQPD